MTRGFSPLFWKHSHLVQPVCNRAEDEEARIGGAGSRTDLRAHWAPASAQELERFETDVLSGLVSQPEALSGLAVRGRAQGQDLAEGDVGLQEDEAGLVDGDLGVSAC